MTIEKQEKMRVNVMLPTKLVDKVDDWSNEHGMSRTASVAFMLTKFFDYEESKNALNSLPEMMKLMQEMQEVQDK